MPTRRPYSWKKNSCLGSSSGEWGSSLIPIGTGGSARLTNPVCPQSRLCWLTFSARHCKTANGLAALDFTALCLVAAVKRSPLPPSVEVAGFSFSDRCCEASVSLGSPLSVGSPARASDACCHLRLIPFRTGTPGVSVPVSALSAEGQLLGQSPSVTLSLSWIFFHEYGRRVGMVPRSSLKAGKYSQMVEKRTKTTQQQKTTANHSPKAESPPSCSLSSVLR